MKFSCLLQELLCPLNFFIRISLATFYLLLHVVLYMYSKHWLLNFCYIMYLCSTYCSWWQFLRLSSNWKTTSWGFGFYFTNQNFTKYHYMIFSCGKRCACHPLDLYSTEEVLRLECHAQTVNPVGKKNSWF